MNGFQVSGKTVLVTGANRGIGKAIAAEVLRRGAGKLYATARSIDSLAELAKDSRVVPVQLDVTKTEDIAALRGVISGLDIIINNAGIANGTSFTASDSVEIARLEMDTNYFGPLSLLNVLVDQVRGRPDTAIVNISSIAGISNFPPLAPYSATKAALHSLTQGLRAELKPQGTHVVGVYPGPVDTRMTEGMEMPKATPAEVAKEVVDAVEQGLEDVFPDAFSKDSYKAFLQDPKSLEGRFAEMA